MWRRQVVKLVGVVYIKVSQFKFLQGSKVVVVSIQASIHVFAPHQLGDGQHHLVGALKWSKRPSEMIERTSVLERDLFVSVVTNRQTDVKGVTEVLHSAHKTIR